MHRPFVGKLGCFLSLLSAAFWLETSLAQNGPFSKSASVRLGIASQVQQKDREFKVDLIVNLNGATGFNGSGSVTPAVLGAFLFNVGFSPSDFQLLGVENGTAPEFNVAPVYTNPSIANSSGFVGVVNSQTGAAARPGDSLVARVRLKPLRCFASSLLVPNPPAAANPMSLSSAYLGNPSPSGPALIQFLAGPAQSIRSVQRGDANGDGLVNAEDIVATIRAIFEAGTRNGLQDCNQSGSYNVADVLCAVLAALSSLPGPCL